jgi:hypothetical protein
MLRVVVVASAMHGIVGFAQVPRSTEQESLETRTSGTGPTVQCGEKVTKSCLAQKVDAMGAQLNTFLIEGPHYDKMYSIEAQLQAQIQEIWAFVELVADVAGEVHGRPQAHPADACDYDSGDLFDGTACVHQDGACQLGTVFTSRDQLKAAVDEWVDDKTAAEKAHGLIADWDTSRVEDMSGVGPSASNGWTYSGFFPTNFNSELAWDTSSVTSMIGTFNGAKVFNKPLEWDTSKVRTMHNTFGNAANFNKPLEWDTSKVTDMSYTFEDAEAFNRPLDWDTSQVTTMYETFRSADRFNAPLGWDTSKVTSMAYTFDQATTFNRQLAWDTSSVTTMDRTFSYARSFNQQLNWDMSKVTTMRSTFHSATAFEQDLSKWDLASVTYFRFMFSQAGCESTNCGCDSCVN